ncbi:hypothetical protein P389DRAFT_12531 [Cystobasidium minutum MCA 4210]|uniref:uncharacterized protein n=1 Tax=Cystobasidium minutum MCA 4210 TaxID=1397322 RepID=UPI0034CDB5C8|eukprot:jgi/Rhomi1/12531/CE12530_47
MSGKSRMPAGAFHIQLFSLAMVATAWEKIRVLRLIRVRQSKEPSSSARLVDPPRQVMDRIEAHIAADTYKSTANYGWSGALSKAPLLISWEECCESTFWESPEYEMAEEQFVNDCEEEDLESWGSEDDVSEGSDLDSGPEDGADWRARRPTHNHHSRMEPGAAYDAFPDSEAYADAFAEFMEKHMDSGKCMLGTGDIAFWEKVAPTNRTTLVKEDPFEYRKSLKQLRSIIDRFMSECQLAAIKQSGQPVPDCFFRYRIEDSRRMKLASASAAAKSPAMKPTSAMPEFISAILRLGVVNPDSEDGEPMQRESVRLGDILMPIPLMDSTQPRYCRASRPRQTQKGQAVGGQAMGANQPDQVKAT